MPVLELEWLRSQREKIGEKGGMQRVSADIPFSKQLQKLKRIRKEKMKLGRKERLRPRPRRKSSSKG